MSRTILLATVGGSHQPIVTAIESLRPDYTIFVCSDDDAATGKPGSHIQIERSGLCIKAHPADEKVTLPNIPMQCGLMPEQWEVIRIEADSLESSVERIRRQIGLVEERDGDQVRWIADYTGGTKTMSAALVLAAIERPNVDLHVVSGPRSNLIRVEDRSQEGMVVTVDRLRFNQQLQAGVAVWQQHGYEMADCYLSALTPPSDTALRGLHARLRDLSRAFAAWDRFDHPAAAGLLQRYQAKVGSVLSVHLTFLKMLNDQPGERTEAARVVDLWLNAERRAIQQRYDDAVARCYRLWEWSVQWLLRSRFQIDTSDLPAEVATRYHIDAGRDGVFQCGLMKGWEILTELTSESDPLKPFLSGHRSRLLDLTRGRNYSILAHGDQTVTAEQWHSIREWTGEQLLPALYPAMQKCGFKLDPARLQLPDSATPLLA